MARTFEIRARVDGVLAKRAQARAAALGLTLSDYLRSLVDRDLQHGGDADALARMIAEVSITSGMLARRLLTQSLGPDEAKALEIRAHEKATGMVDEILKR